MDDLVGQKDHRLTSDPKRGGVQHFGFDDEDFRSMVQTQTLSENLSALISSGKLMFRNLDFPSTNRRVDSVIAELIHRNLDQHQNKKRSKGDDGEGDQGKAPHQSGDGEIGAGAWFDTGFGIDRRAVD